MYSFLKKKKKDSKYAFELLRKCSCTSKFLLGKIHSPDLGSTKMDPKTGSKKSSKFKNASKSQWGVTILITSWKQNQVSFSYVRYHDVPDPSERWFLDPNVFSLFSLWVLTICFPEDINDPKAYCFTHWEIHPNKNGKARLCSLSSQAPFPRRSMRPNSSGLCELRSWLIS